MLKLPSMRLLSRFPSFPELSRINIGYPASEPGEPTSPEPGVPGVAEPGGNAVGFGLICDTAPPVH